MSNIQFRNFRKLCVPYFFTRQIHPYLCVCADDVKRRYWIH